MNWAIERVIGEDMRAYGVNRGENGKKNFSETSTFQIHGVAFNGIIFSDNPIVIPVCVI